jgi:hypothetical protein
MQKNVFLMTMDSASHFAKRKQKSAQCLVCQGEKRNCMYALARRLGEVVLNTFEFQIGTCSFSG